MKNKDLLKEENKELMQALSQALKEDDDDAMAEAFAAFAEGVQERIMEEYKVRAKMLRSLHPAASDS